MTKCPQCQATLPDGAVHCQFCGTTFGNTPPPPRGGLHAATAYTGGTPGWVRPAYYGIAGWWVVSGIWDVLSATVFRSHGGVGIFTLAIGGFTAIIGLGLLARIEVVRGLVNISCFLNILDGALGLIISFFMTGILGWLGAIMMILNIVKVVLAVLMIFLIGETETRAPNF